MYAPTGEPGRPDLAETVRLIESLGGRERTVEEAVAHTVRAQDFLGRLSRSADARAPAAVDDLRGLTTFLADRTR